MHIGTMKQNLDQLHVTDFNLRYSFPVPDCFSATQTREGRHLEQNTLLKEEIRKLSRDRSVRVVFLLNRNSFKTVAS